MRPRLVILLAAIAVTTATTNGFMQAPAATAGCTDARMRALDFWVGRWDVQGPAGQTRASSEITIVADGCAILERYTGLPGPAGKAYVGAGLHVFDRTEGGWRQLWSDNQLGAKLLSGKASGADIVYTWDVIEKGKRIPKRYTLSGSQPGHPRRVRQLGERSDDDGKTWTTEFDLRYVPATAR